jgi:hypothetical protein
VGARRLQLSARPGQFCPAIRIAWSTVSKGAMQHLRLRLVLAVLFAIGCATAFALVA